MKKKLIVFFLLMIPLMAFASVVYYGSGKAVFLEDVLELKSGNQFSADGTNFSLNTAKLTDVVDPTLDQDAATKKYVDDEISGSGGANIELDNLGTTAVNTDVIPDAITHDLGTTLLPWQNVYQRGSFYYLAGSSIGSISGSGSDLNIVSTSGGLNLIVDDLTFTTPAQIKNVSDPTDDQDVVTKNYLENNPSGLPVIGKGSLITSNGTVNGELTKCPDGEFLMWDNAEDAGMKCSGAVLEHAASIFDSTSAFRSTSFLRGYQVFSDTIMYMNYNTSTARNAGINWHNNGGTSYTYSMYQHTNNNMYFLNSTSGGSQLFYTNNTLRLDIQPDGGISISDIGGNGGNIPHKCVVRSSTNSTGTVNAYCVSGDEIATGGGCYSTDTQQLYLTLPTGGTTSAPPTGWRCATAAQATTAFAVCCQY